MRVNAATLLLHLMGRAMGLVRSGDPHDPMSPFAFDEDRKEIARFDAASLP